MRKQMIQIWKMKIIPTVKFGTLTKLTVIKNLVLLCVMLHNPVDSFSQRFKAAAIVGMNASQIDGDNLYGFKKLGLQAGGRLSYQNSKVVDIALEMLYSQRGSAVNYFSNAPEDKIDLRYLELPLVLSLRDWYIEEGKYYKVRAEGGLSYGYLFGVRTPGYPEENFRRHDVSWLVAAGIQLNRWAGFSLRYTSSLGKMYKDPFSGSAILHGYFLTLRGEFTL
ncbi:MAG: PorT family protein [Saprospiraceae bacterium]|jgi:hypothetical protein|nr:PorT family protein [Saprospiraceae bacterium]